eukprot:m.188184 g.188184  ORF g.188184 m.188184 type:complete len:81 (+) comp15080_c0_seq1:1047-1289(+)
MPLAAATAAAQPLARPNVTGKGPYLAVWQNVGPHVNLNHRHGQFVQFYRMRYGEHVHIQNTMLGVGWRFSFDNLMDQIDV